MEFPFTAGFDRRVEFLKVSNRFQARTRGGIRAATGVFSFTKNFRRNYATGMKTYDAPAGELWIDETELATDGGGGVGEGVNQFLSQ